MDSTVGILVTGVGAPGTMGTLHSLRENPLSLEFNIVGTDINPSAVGRYFVNKFFVVPKPDDEELYIERIITICKNESVQFVLPQTTKEVEVLSKHKDVFKNEDIRIIASDYDSLSISNNKCNLLQICKEYNIPYPSFRKVTNLDGLVSAILAFGYPEHEVVVKPCFSNGLRGVRIVTTRHLSEEYYFKEKPNGLFISLEELRRTFLSSGEFSQPLVVQEYLPGEEYTVDVFQWKDFTVAIPRKRLKIRSGISFESIVKYHQEMIEMSQKLSKILGLQYCFGFQFKLDKNGVPKILESNPRIQGTMVASTFAGFNMIFLSVLVEIDERKALELMEESFRQIKWNTRFERYWGRCTECL